VNKLHSTNELQINLPAGLGPIDAHATVIPRDEAHQAALIGTGWFTVGEELPAKPEPVVEAQAEASSEEPTPETTTTTTTRRK
jgi:hypothetical protein